MNFTVDCQNFMSIMKSCIKGFSPKDDRSYVLFTIDTKKNKLKITTRSSNTLFKGEASLSVFSEDLLDKDIEDLNYCVDGNKLKTIMSILPTTVDGLPLSFKLQDNSSTFEIEYGKGNTLKLGVLDTPMIAPDEQRTIIGTVPADSFLHVLTSASRSVATDIVSIDSAANCVHLFIDEKEFTVMGTDSYSVTEFKREYNTKAKINMLLRFQQVNLLAKSTHANEEFKLVDTKSMFGYVDEDGVLALVAKANALPTEYEFIKQYVSDECYAIIDKTTLKDVVDRISKLSPTDEYTTIIINEDKTMKLENDNGDVLYSTVEDTNVTGEVKQNFPKVPLNKLLNNCEDRIKLEWADDDSQTNSVVKVSSVVKKPSVDEDEEATFDVDTTLFMCITNIQS